MVNDLLNRGNRRCVCLTLIWLGNHVPHFGIHIFGGRSIQCVDLTPISNRAVRLILRLLGFVKFVDTLIGIHLGKYLMHDLRLVEMVDMFILGL